MVHQHQIYSLVWIFWLAYGLNQCSKELVMQLSLPLQVLFGIYQ